MTLDGSGQDEFHNEALRKLGARIRQARRKRGLTQRDVSFPGCTYSYLARIESGDRRPSPRVLVEIARRLDVSPEELTGEVSTEQRGRSLELLDATVMVRQGRIDDAEDLLRGVMREAKVAGDAQRIGEASEGLAAVAAARGDRRSAGRLLEQSRDAGPPPDPAERAELYERLFDVYRQAGDLARAIALAEDCVERLRRAPVVDGAKVVRFAVMLARAYSLAGEPGRAAAVLGEALREGGDLVDTPTRAAAEYELSRRYAAMGAVDQAVRHADRSLLLYDLDEDSAALGEAHLVYAQRLLDAGDEAAGTHLRAARNLLRGASGPDGGGRMLVEEARYALLLGDTAEAGRLARDAVQALGSEAAGPHLGEAHLVLARVQDELGEVERADAAYTAALDAFKAYGPDSRDIARAYRWYGKFLKRIGRAEAALEAFELAADLAPSNRDSMAPSEQAVHTAET